MFMFSVGYFVLDGHVMSQAPDLSLTRCSTVHVCMGRLSPAVRMLKLLVSCSVQPRCMTSVCFHRLCARNEGLTTLVVYTQITAQRLCSRDSTEQRGTLCLKGRGRPWRNSQVTSSCRVMLLGWENDSYRHYSDRIGLIRSMLQSEVVGSLVNVKCYFCNAFHVDFTWRHQRSCIFFMVT